MGTESGVKKCRACNTEPAGESPPCIECKGATTSSDGPVGYDGDWYWCSPCDLVFQRPAHTDGGLGRKFDSGKPPMGLLPGDALLKVAEVLEFGAKKYEPNNWRHVKPGSRYLDAALRHLHAYADGEDNDPDSGLSHVAHAACCVLFMISLGDCRHD